MIFKQNIKKYLSMVLALMFVLGMSGCNQKQQSDVSTGTVKLAKDGIYPLESDDVLTVWTALNGNISTIIKNFGETEIAKALKEKTGVNITYIHPAQGQESEQFNLLLASNDLPDIIQRDWYTLGAQSSIDAGYINKLNEPIEKWAPNLKGLLEKNKDFERMVKTDEDSLYVFPFFRGDSKDCIYSGPIIRKDWLDKLGMSVPTTISEWETMLRAFKTQLNVEIPLSVNTSYFTNGMFSGAYGVNGTFFIDDNGDVKYGPIEEGYGKFLELMSNWYKQGLLDKNMANVDGKIIETNMLNNRLGATAGGAAGALGKWMVAKKSKDASFELVGAPYPVLNNGDRPKFSTREWDYIPSSSYAISSQCKNVELATRFLDYGYSEEGRMLYNFGIEGVSYTMKDGKPKFTDLVTNEPNGQTLAVALMKYAMGSYSGPFVQDTRVVEQMQSNPKQQREAVNVWAETDAEKHIMPLVSFTKDEKLELSNIMSEVNTYTSEMMLKFIVGAEPLSNFSKYKEQIKKLNIDRALELYKKAVNRYNVR